MKAELVITSEVFMPLQSNVTVLLLPTIETLLALVMTKFSCIVYVPDKKLKFLIKFSDTALCYLVQELSLVQT